MKAGIGRVIIKNLEKRKEHSDFTVESALQFRRATIVDMGDTPTSNGKHVPNDHLNGKEFLMGSKVVPLLLPIKSEEDEELFLIKSTNVEVIL